MFGSHLSIAGSMANALHEARALGLDCVQVFTKNQQQWSAPALADGVVETWLAALRELGWDSAKGSPGPSRVVSHASYLSNLASPDDALRLKSLALMRDELDRCERLAIGLLVFHPGAATGSTREEGLERIAQGVASLLAAARTGSWVLCLENVAGAGTTLGRTLDELAWLRARAIELGAPSGRVGFCLDTCHAHAAGYDLSTRAGGEAFVAQVDRVLGLAHVRVLHLNDSKGGVSSRLDRHQHIGEGTIGPAGFAGVLACAPWREIPKILETPKGQTPDGVAFDTINVARLRALAGKGELSALVAGEAFGRRLSSASGAEAAPGKSAVRAKSKAAETRAKSGPKRKPKATRSRATKAAKGRAQRARGR